MKQEGPNTGQARGQLGGALPDYIGGWTKGLQPCRDGWQAPQAILEYRQPEEVLPIERSSKAVTFEIVIMLFPLS
jgi:hypothetical protein